MFKLSAVRREKKGEKIRREGLLPAVIYGSGKESESLALTYIDFVKLYKKAGESSLIDLSIDNKDSEKVLVHDVTYDPVTNNIIHVDFIRIDMNKNVTAAVELVFEGESKAVKESGGTIVKMVEEVQIECLPKNLISHIEIDLSKLKSFDDVIKVSDLVLAEGIKIIEPQEEVIIVKAQRAITEEEIKALEEQSSIKVDVSKIESATPKKSDEDKKESEKK